MSATAAAASAATAATVFSAEGCSYCSQAKTLLARHNTRIIEVDVDLYPARYAAAAAATRHSTVPLIFLGHKFVGGAAQLDALAKSGELSCGSSSEANPECVPEFLRPFTDEEEKFAAAKRAERAAEANLAASFEDVTLSVQLGPASVVLTYTQILRALRGAVKPADSGSFFWKRKLVVTGQELIAGVASVLTAAAPAAPATAIAAAAPRFAAALVHQAGMLYDSDVYAFSAAAAAPAHSAADEIGLEKRYRFQADSAVDLGSKTVLNGSRMLRSYQPRGSAPIVVPADAGAGYVQHKPPAAAAAITAPSADVLGRALRLCVDGLQSRFRDGVDGKVDFGAMKGGGLSEECVCLLTLLQGVDLASLKEDERKALFINVYNSMVPLGMAQRGVPWGNLDKLSFFGSVAVVMGGQNMVFSLNDLENGLLRGNRKGVTDFLSLPFAAADPRLPLACRADYRIHAALNCGAASCPPVKTYTAAALNDELDRATRAFLRSTTSWKPNSKTLHLSMILKWYAADFVTESGPVQDLVIRWLDDEVRQRILADVGPEGTSTITVAYDTYDWAIAAKK